MNNFTIDMAVNSEKMNSNSKLRFYIKNVMLNFMEKNFNQSKVIQKEISEQLRFSDSTIKGYRVDINMDSPYIRNIYKKKTTNWKTNTKISSTQDPPKNENSKSTTNKKTENNILKDGDPNKNHMSEKEFIEKAFSNCFVEDNQEDYTKFITLARKMIDSN